MYWDKQCMSHENRIFNIIDVGNAYGKEIEGPVLWIGSTYI